MRVNLRLVATLLFGSGLSALVYQTAWQRTFRLTFGASTSASAAVLAVFLGGLGIGGLWFGRRVDSSRRPLLFYGNLELAIALWAAATPLLSELVHSVYLALGGSARLGTWGATFVRLLGTTIVIGPATFLMGGTLPAAARAAVTEDDESRRGLALVYALNTTGAVIGALVGPLLLFGVLGTRLTLWLAVCINLLVALVARGLGRSFEVPVATAEAPPASERGAAREAAPPDTARAALIQRVVYVAAALVGFVFLALELVWYRVLAPILGGSSLTFGLILATALAGIGFGGWLYSRRPKDRPPTLELLAFTLVIEAFCALLPFAWGDDLALVVAQLRAVGTLGFDHLLVTWLWVAFVVVFPTAAVSGYQFPLLFALLGAGRKNVAVHVGTTYAFNTIGTIAGSLFGGFLLLPSWGATTTWRVLGLSLLVLGVVVGLLHAWSARARRGFGVALGSLALLAGVTVFFSLQSGPGAVWRHSPIGAGRVRLEGLSPNQIIAWRRDAEDAILWEKDGIESTVALSVRNDLAFLVNGKSDGSVTGDRGTQTFLGLLPAALHPAPKKAFVVGLGTGMTAGILGKAPGVERVLVAELEPTIIEVARRATLANEDVLENPRVEIAFGDGRELLLTSKEEFELIISEPSNPYRIGVASLFTRDFYEAARSRLSRGGIFAQWIQGYEIDAGTLSMILHTLREVFPEISIWGPEGNDLLILGSEAPLPLDLAELEARVAHPYYVKWMRRTWSMEGALALLAHQLVPSELVRELTDRLPREANTDDLNQLEFAFSRLVGQDHYVATADIFTIFAHKPLRPTVTGEVDWQRFDDLRHRIGWDGYELAASPKAQATSLGCGSRRIDEATRLWPEGEEPQDLIEAFVLAQIEAGKKSDRAAELAARLEREGFAPEAFLVRSLLAHVRGDLKAATGHLTTALHKLRDQAFPLCEMTETTLTGAALLAQKDRGAIEALLPAVAQAPFPIYQDELNRRVIQAGLGAQSENPQLCADSLGAFRARPVWSLPQLAARAACLQGAGAPDADAAWDDLRLYQATMPSQFDDPTARLLAPSGWARAYFPTLGVH